MTSGPLPDDVRDLLAKPNPAVITTLRPDGQPVSVATWYLLEPDRSRGDRILVNMDEARKRLAHLRALLSRGRFTFSEAVGRADRVTVAVTLYALLELYKQGEATWDQPEPFAEITVHGSRPGRARTDGAALAQPRLTA